jgi:hypothetical protein
MLRYGNRKLYANLMCEKRKNEIYFVIIQPRLWNFLLMNYFCVNNKKLFYEKEKYSVACRHTAGRLITGPRE